MKRSDGHEGEHVYLGRSGQEHGPYSWDDILRFAADGELNPGDLLWSPSLGAWTAARKVDGLFPSSAKPAKLSSPRSVTLFVLVYLSAMAIIAAITCAIVFWPSGIQVKEVFPTEGAPGSYVVISLDGDVAPDDLKAFFNDVPLSVTGLTAKHVAVHIPLDAVSGLLSVFWKDKPVASLPFTVVKPTLQTLHEEQVKPSRREQTVVTDDGFSVTLPGGLLTRESTLSIAEVEHPAVFRTSPFTEPQVYDISIEGLDQLEDFVEIGIPFDADLLDSSIPAHAHFSPARWDEADQRWVDLYYRVDESTGTLYVVSDHLSSFLTGFSIVGLGKTAAIVAVVGGSIAEIAERWVNDKYLSKGWKVRVLYSDKALRATFPDDRWQQAISGARLRIVGGYDSKPSSAVQDIALILEESLKCYIKAGFPDPTKKGIWGAHLYTRYVKVKVDSLYNYHLQQGEMAHESFWNTIHLPSELLKLNFFDPVESGRGTFEDNFGAFKSGLAHELFHAFQVPYYGWSAAFIENQHRWWREACAEWAGSDLARIPSRPGWDRDAPELMNRIGHGFLRHPINSTGKIRDTTTALGGLDYEYLAAIFVRYLIRELNLDFKKLVVHIARGDGDTDALVYLKSYLAKQPGKILDRVYLDFAVWLLQETQLPLSDFGNPGNTRVVAGKQETVTIAEKRSVVMLSHHSALGAERLLVFKAAEGEEKLRQGQTPALVFDERGQNHQEFEVEDGEILYIVCANGRPEDRSVVLTIEQKTQTAAKPWGKVAQYPMALQRDGTAGIWAVKISAGNLTIEPARLDNAPGNRKLPFKVKLNGLAKEIKEVTLDYDFGDASASATGSVTTAVVDGEAAVELTHSFAPTPGIEANAKPRTYILSVNALRDGKVFDSAEASVSVAKAEVSIQPPRSIVLQLAGGATQATESFIAMAEPKGEYRFEWDFGDGGAFSDPSRRDNRSQAQHTFTGLAPGINFSPTVELYDRQGSLLARDQISVTVDEVTPPTPTAEPKKEFQIKEVYVTLSPGALTFSAGFPIVERGGLMQGWISEIPENNGSWSVQHGSTVVIDYTIRSDPSRIELVWHMQKKGSDNVTVSEEKCSMIVVFSADRTRVNTVDYESKNYGRQPATGKMELGTHERFRLTEIPVKEDEFSIEQGRYDFVLDATAGDNVQSHVPLISKDSNLGDGVTRSISSQDWSRADIHIYIQGWNDFFP